eukprot:gene8091-389_t
MGMGLPIIMGIHILFCFIVASVAAGELRLNTATDGTFGGNGNRNSSRVGINDTLKMFSATTVHLPFHLYHHHHHHHHQVDPQGDCSSSLLQRLQRQEEEEERLLYLLLDHKAPWGQGSENSERTGCRMGM